MQAAHHADIHQILAYADASGERAEPQRIGGRPFNQYDVRAD